MPVSKELLEEFDLLISEYENTGLHTYLKWRSDVDFSKLFTKLKVTKETILYNWEAFNDRTLINLLLQTAGLVMKNNPTFSFCVQNFLVRYQARTSLLTSILDESPRLDVVPEETEVNSRANLEKTIINQKKTYDSEIKAFGRQLEAASQQNTSLKSDNDALEKKAKELAELKTKFQQLSEQLDKSRKIISQLQGILSPVNSGATPSTVNSEAILPTVQNEFSIPGKESLLPPPPPPPLPPMPVATRASLTESNSTKSLPNEATTSMAKKSYANKQPFGTVTAGLFAELLERVKVHEISVQRTQESQPISPLQQKPPKPTPRKRSLVSQSVIIATTEVIPSDAISQPAKLASESPTQQDMPSIPPGISQAQSKSTFFQQEQAPQSSPNEEKPDSKKTSQAQKSASQTKHERSFVEALSDAITQRRGAMEPDSDRESDDDSEDWDTTSVHSTSASVL